MAAKSKTYELAVKIAGKYDSSMKKACLDAEKDLSALGKERQGSGKGGHHGLDRRRYGGGCRGDHLPFYIRRL